MEASKEKSGSILVLAPRGRDASVIAHVLLPLGHCTTVCASLLEMVNQLDETAVAAVVTEESLRDEGAPALQEWIDRQPPWSDFPFVVLATKQVGSRSSQASAALAELGNGVLLERPLNAETLTSAVNSAVRSRSRQYETRSHLQQQETIGAENRRLYEAEREARSEAEAANRAKDEFLATLSHELRTPLSAILGWTYVLLQRRQDLGDLARGVDTIERNARAQARLIEDLLDMSRIVAGKVSLELQTVVPAHLVEQVIASVQPSIQAKNITIERSLSAAMIPIIGDPPAAAAGSMEPVDECREVHRRRRTNHRRRSCRRRADSLERHGQRRRDRAELLATGFREIPASRWINNTLPRRPWAGPGDCQETGRTARRLRGCDQRRARLWSHLHGASSHRRRTPICSRSQGRWYRRRIRRPGARGPEHSGREGSACRG